MKKTIERRLAALPPKVALPLTQLVKIGQMREQYLQTVLDAGDLTGNHQTLVGFAAGAMGMKAQGVPIADTVSMVKSMAAESDWTGALAVGERNMTGCAYHCGNIPTFFRLLWGLSSPEKIGVQQNHD